MKTPALAVCLLSACVSAPRPVDSLSATEAAALRAEARSEHRRIRDLENRLALLAAGGQPDAVAVAPATTPPPIAPSPTPAAPVASDPEPTLAAGPTEVDPGSTGLTDDGVDVVYEGEAAEPGAKVPRLTLRGEPAAASNLDDSDLDPPLEVTASTGELPVTTGEIPTVASQLRRARAAVPRARASAGDPRADYQRYVDALRAGNYAYAIAGLKNFLARYPGHDYADNAQYWLGEAAYAQKDWKGALAAFDAVVRNYPHGNKVPDALLKGAFCQLQLGQADAARTALVRITTEFPRSNPAALASAKLTELGK